MANTRRKRTPRRSRGPFNKHFTDDELDRIITAFGNAEVAEGSDVSASGLDAITEATYVLLDRIIARMSAQVADNAADDSTDGKQAQESFLKLVRAHNDTTGRVAQLVRARHVVNGSTGEALTGNIAEALDRLSEYFNQNL